MSFLYKALMKDNHNISNRNQASQNRANPQNNFDNVNSDNTSGVEESRKPQTGFQYNAGAHNTFHQPFAQSDNRSQNGIMWFAIAILLLVVGLLAGFIWGNQSQLFGQTALQETARQETVLTSTSVALEPLFDGSNLSLQDSDLAQSTSSSQSNSPAHSSGPEIDVRETLSSEEIQEAAVDLPTKQVEVAVNQQGNVVSKVTAGNFISESANTPNTISGDTALSSNVTDLNDPEINDTEINANELVTANQQSEISLEEIPEELKALFAEAVKATEVDEQIQDRQNEDLFSEQRNNSDQNVVVETSLQDINTLNQNERYLIPSLKYQMHIFSSDRTERWVKINDQPLLEGDELVNGLTLIEIRQNIIIWQTDTRRFSQRALEDFN